MERIAFQNMTKENYNPVVVLRDSGRGSKSD